LPRDSLLLEGVDLLSSEAARRDDLHTFEPVTVERVANLVHQALVDAPWIEVAHLLPERSVDELACGVEADAPEARAERTSNLERGRDGVVLEVDEDRAVPL